MKSAFKNFGRIASIFPGKFLLVVIIFLTVILAAAELSIFYSLRFLMDSVLEQDFSFFYQMLWIFLGVILINTVVTYFRNRWAGKYAMRGIKVLRGQLGRHTLDLPIKSIDSYHSGDMLSRLTNDMTLVEQFTTITMINIIFDPLTAIGAFILIFSLHWKLALVCTIGIPLVIVLASLASAPVAKYTRKLQEELATLNSYVQDTVTGIEIVRAFNLEKILGKKFADALVRFIQYGYKVAAAQCVLGGLNLISSLAPFLLSFGFGGYWVIRGEMTPGALIAFINLLNPLAAPIAALPQLIGNLRGQMEGASRIFEILDLDKERQDGEEFIPKHEDAVISFDDVTFAYNEEGEQVLNQMSFDIQAGEKVALVGTSGSGKSTVMRLILGYYDDYQGKIEILGNNLRDWNLHQLRDYLSLVSQDTYLFPGSLEENIAYGRDGVTKEEIQEAAKTANAHEFISKLRDGYETKAGEFGDKLSGGQKQRISIARAVLKQAPILLLDEATSALDTHSEHLVQKALDNFMEEKATALIIAHRLSTIQNADRILVVHGGRIVESGSHDELLAREGLYKRLYLRQLAKEEKDMEEEAVV